MKPDSDDRELITNPIPVAAAATVTESAKVGLDEALAELPVVAAECYQLLGEVARGGVGRIIRARDLRLGREVALKQLHHSDSASRARFAREALVTARLQHPAIIPVHAETVVIDWGLAKQLEGRDLDAATPTESPPHAAASMTGQVLGTPAYMPPEQALGRPADKRSDVYALGALLYQVVAGAAPFVGQAAGEVLRQVLTTRPRSLRLAQPEAPTELVAIVDRAMAARADDRYPDARAMAADLHSFQLGQLTSVRRAEAEDDPALLAEFDVEQRLRTRKSVRVTSVLGLILIALFAFLDLVPFHGFVNRELAVRLVLLMVIGGILAASHRPFGLRWSHALGSTLLTLIGLFLIGLGWMRHEAHDVLFTPSMLIVFLGCSALFQLPRGTILAVLCSLTASQLLVAVVWEHPSPFELVCEMAFLAAGTVIVVIGADIRQQLRRAEFYGRRRLERANQRLAQLGQRSG